MDLETRSNLSPLRAVGAVGFGLLLCAIPFLRYSPLLHGGEAHMDHEPHHGGQLGMVGDHHIEVSRDDLIEVFVSDGRRVALRPRRGWVAFDGGQPQPLSWERYRMITGNRPGRDLDVTVILDDGTSLSTTFDFSDE